MSPFLLFTSICKNISRQIRLKLSEMRQDVEKGDIYRKGEEIKERKGNKIE